MRGTSPHQHRLICVVPTELPLKDFMRSFRWPVKASGSVLGVGCTRGTCWLFGFSGAFQTLHVRILQGPLVPAYGSDWPEKRRAENEAGSHDNDALLLHSGLAEMSLGGA